jgi:hypothetical protein
MMGLGQKEAAKFVDFQLGFADGQKGTDSKFRKGGEIR